MVVRLFLFLMSVSMAKSLRQAALVTGSTDGIGVTTAKHLAAKGYDVLIHGRDEQRILKSLVEIKKFAEKHSDTSGQVMALPPSDLATVDGATKLAKDTIECCSKNNLELSVLLNNAGVYSEKRVITPEGLELTFAVNVLATFVVTSHLLPLLRRQKSRIVIASSISQCRSIRDWDDLTYFKRSYSAHAAYAESKLLDAMLTMDMAQRFQSAGFDTSRITCNCLDPGTVNTKMLLAGWGPIGIDVEDALGQTYLCTSKEVATTTGKYFVSSRESRPSPDANDENEQKKLWDLLSSLAPEAAKEWDALKVI